MMQWKRRSGRSLSRIGHLFAYIECCEAYGNPGQPGYEAETFEWFIAPDDEDKNYRRALSSGEAATFSDAEDAIRAKIKALAEKLLADL